MCGYTPAGREWSSSIPQDYECEWDMPGGTSINILTGSESNNVFHEGPVGSSINMLTGSESNILREEIPKVANG
jgi:hypothetical protein